MIEPDLLLSIPYPGLRPFEAEDQAMFFGRETQVGAMLRRLEDNRFLAVVGASGCGKSSLIRAGLLPAVREGFLLGVTDWRIVVIKPGHQPFLRLAHELSKPGDPDGRKSHQQISETTDTQIFAMLRQTDHGLLDVLNSLEIKKPTIVVVDQFEELFSFRRENVKPDEVASRDESAAFVKMLLCTCDGPDNRVWVLLTMRSDFIGHCEAFLGLPEAVSRSQFLVPRLDRSQMEEAIMHPGDVTCARFTPFAFEKGLVNRIINEAGDRPDQLPLMQHALMRTWKLAVQRCQSKDISVQLTSVDYDKAGGIEKALSLDADVAWTLIEGDPKKACIARHLFLLLCDISLDGQITRRRPRVREVEAVTGASVIEIGEVIRLFQADDRNFLILSGLIDSDTYIDISHEALLRQWQLFATRWLVDEREDWSELRRLTELSRLSNRGLLSEQDLYRVGRWQNRVSEEWASRYVSNEAWKNALAFIAKSQQNVKSTKLKKVLWRTLAGTVFVSISLTFIVLANSAREDALKALTDSYARTIGKGDELSPDEITALQELAELNPRYTNVRKKLLDRWFQDDKKLLFRALLNDGRGLRAAIGLDPVQHSKLAQIAYEPLVQTLIDPKTDSNYLQSLVNALIALPPPTKTIDTVIAAKHLVQTLENPKTDSFRLSSYGKALTVLAPRLELNDAASVTDRLIQVLVDPKTDSYRQSSIVDVLVVLVSRLEAKDAASMAEPLIQALGAPNTGSYRLLKVREVLVVLLPRLEAKDAASIAERLVKAQEEPNETDSDRLLNRVKILVELAHRLEAKDTVNLARRATQVSVQTLINPKIDSYRLASPIETLDMLAPYLAAKDVASLAEQLLKALDDPNITDPIRLSSLGKAMTTLMPRVEAKDGGRIAEQLIQTLDHPKVTDEEYLFSLRKALSDLATNLEAKKANIVAERLVQTLTDPNVIDSGRLLNLGEILAAIVSRLEMKDATRLTEQLAEALENKKTINSDRLLNLGKPLSVLLPQLEMKNASSIAMRATKVLLQALINPNITDSYHLSSLKETINALTPKLEAFDAVSITERLIQVLIEPKAYSYRQSTIVDILAVLVPHLETKDAARMVEQLVQALVKPNIESYHLSNFGEVLVMLSPRLEAKSAARIAERLIMVLENPNIDQDHKSVYGKVLAALASQLDAKDAVTLAEQLVPALLDPKAVSYRLSNLEDILVILSPRLEVKNAARLADRLVKALEDPNDKDIDLLLSRLKILIKLANRLEAKDAANFTRHATQILIKKIVNPKTDSYRLANLVEKLVMLTPHLESKDAAIGAEELINELNDPNITDSKRFTSIRKALVALAQKIPSAPSTKLFALSKTCQGSLTNKDRNENEEHLERDTITKLSSSLSRQDLSEVLKWPFCVGETEKIVLVEMEKKTGKSFEGNVWKFVEQATELGIRNLDQPAKLPRANDAVIELKKLRNSSIL